MNDDNDDDYLIFTSRWRNQKRVCVTGNICKNNFELSATFCSRLMREGLSGGFRGQLGPGA